MALAAEFSGGKCFFAAENDLCKMDGFTRGSWIFSAVFRV